MWANTAFSQAHLTGTCNMKIRAGPLAIGTVRPLESRVTHSNIATFIVSAIPHSTLTRATNQIHINHYMMHSMFYCNSISDYGYQIDLFFLKYCQNSYLTKLQSQEQSPYTDLDLNT